MARRKLFPNCLEINCLRFVAAVRASAGACGLVFVCVGVSMCQYVSYVCAFEWMHWCICFLEHKDTQFSSK